MATPLEITENNFQQDVIESSMPVLVDFFATWCGPCRMVSPIVEEIADERAGKLKVGKVDVDQQPGLAQRFNITGVPTLILFKDGVVAETVIGAESKEELLATFDPHLA